MLMKRSETNVCFGPLACCQNGLKNMTKYGTIKQMEKVNWITNILLEICTKR